MLDAISRYVDADGLVMHYRVRGKRDAPPLLLLHGIMGNAWEWDAAVAKLAPHFRVYTPDQRGHGRTGWTRPYTAVQLGCDAVALVRALDLWDVTLVGHSMGGIASIHAAASGTGRLARLVLVDIGPRSVRGELASGLVATLRHFATAAYDEPAEAVSEWLAGDPLARADLMRHYVEHGLYRDKDGRYRWRFDAAGLVEFIEDGVEPAELERAVGNVALPTLVLRGHRSQVLSVEAAEEMVRLLPSGDLVEIPGAAHDIGVQQPEAAAMAVLGFTQGLRERLARVTGAPSTSSAETRRERSYAALASARMPV